VGLLKDGPFKIQPEKFRISERCAKAAAKDGMVMVTWANYHYHDFVSNWIANLRKTGYTQPDGVGFLVGAMDSELLELLVEDNVPAFYMGSGLSTGDFGWGSKTFHKMGREKINLIGLFTGYGLDILLSDVDTVWIRDPGPYIARYPMADVLASSDHLSPTYAEDEGLETMIHSAHNIGIMLFRPRARELAVEWSQILDQDETIWDQNAYNSLVKKGGTGPYDGAGSEDPQVRRLFYGYNKKLVVGVLPVQYFCSGHTYFTQRIPQSLGVDPYVVHATFQFSGTRGKRNRFRESMLWIVDPPEYYDAPEKYLAYDNILPPYEVMHEQKGRGSYVIEENVMKHFDLVNMQLRQLRSGFALARALGRILVLPKLRCGMDRWWAPHGGRIPGSWVKGHLPIDPCPADHVLNLENGPLGPGTKGEIKWREYSFLNRTESQHLQNSKLTVKPSDAHEKEELSGDVLYIPTQYSYERVGKVLEEHASAKLFMFEDIGKFDHFDDAATAQSFNSMASQMASIWCCVSPPAKGKPGHIWYDMLFDVIPHKDRHGRQWSTPWEPKCGP